MKKKTIKWVKHIIKEVDNKNKVTQYVVIGKQEETTGLFLVSPYSSFIFEYANKKTTTQISYANVVVPFLNYLWSKYPDFKIDKLTVQDGIDFLNSRDVSTQTKNTYSNILEDFYIFLEQNDVLQTELSYPLFKGKYKIQNKKNTKETIHNLKVEYLPLFIQTAIDVVPEIALGVYLQCFGGLRNSEVVSIEYENIKFQCDSNNVISMVINLKDKDLRPDTEYGFLAKVKKNRPQEIIPAYGNLLSNLYQNHKNTYISDKCNAVFIDEKGLPMTNYTYANKFNKLKNQFIKRLEESEDFEAKAYAMFLKSYKWKTHICRGIFSNQVANSTNNIGEIALWRGDSNLASALTYLNNKEEVGKDVEQILDELYKGGFRI